MHTVLTAHLPGDVTAVLDRYGFTDDDALTRVLITAVTAGWAVEDQTWPRGHRASTVELQLNREAVHGREDLRLVWSSPWSANPVPWHVCLPSGTCLNQGNDQQLTRLLATLGEVHEFGEDL